MNSSFNIILNSQTGHIVVKKSLDCIEDTHVNKTTFYSEKQKDKVYLQSFFKKRTLALYVGIALNALLSPNVFAEMTYTGGSNQLTNSDDIGEMFNSLIENSATNGVFDSGSSVVGNGSVTQSDANITINYLSGITPSFVLSGYALGNANNVTGEAESSKNVITVKNGNINGNLYAGLAHSIVVKNQLDCSVSTLGCTTAQADLEISKKTLISNDNAVYIENEAANTINGDVNAGYAEVKVKAEDFIGGTGASNTFAYIEVDANSNALTANNNTILVSGHDQTANNLKSGYAGVDISYGDLQGGTASVDGLVAAVAYANSYNYMNSNNLTANENIISISGNSNNVKNIESGYAGINASYGNSTGGTSIALSNPRALSNAYSLANASLLENSVIANKNKISISGDHNITENLKAGYGELKLAYGDLTGGTASADPEAYTFTDSYVSTAASDSKLTINENEISISGHGNSANQLMSGYADLSISYGNLTAGTANANGSADVEATTKIKDSVLTVNKNKISISGNENNLNDLKSGYAGLKVAYGDLTAGVVKSNDLVDIFVDTSSDLSIDASSNNLIASQNSIAITGKNNTFNHLNAGYTELDISTGDILGGVKLKNNPPSYDDATLNVDLSNTTLVADKNIISLNGSSTVNGNINTGYINFNVDYGAIQDGDESAGTIAVDLTGTSAQARDNIISIDGHHEFTDKNATIYGGYLAYNTVNGTEYKPETYDVFTGNTLNYANKTPIQIGEIANFQTYNFTLTPELGNTDTALISAKSIILGSNEDNISDGSKVASDIKVVGIHSGELVATDSKFILMQADDGQLKGLGQGTVSKGIAQQGISLLYDVETTVDQKNNQVIAVINKGHTAPPPVDPVEPEPAPVEPPVGPKVNPQLKALLEGNLSGLMLLTRSADNLSDNLSKKIDKENNYRSVAPLFILSGDHTRYDTGSHIKSNSGSIAAGLTFQQERFSAGLFVENGWDGYNTYNDFNDVADVNGKGHNSFIGAGTYGNYDFENGWYADGALRVGRLRTAFETDDIRNAATNERAEYTLKRTYYGLNLKGGYAFQMNEANNLDLSLKYLWSGTESQNLKVAGDPLHFSHLNSHRVQFNAENTYQMNPVFSIVSAIGYEYEFDAKSEGTTYKTFNIDAPSLKGSTGIASIGLRYKPTAFNRLSMDVKAGGYFGKREGGNAVLKLDYTF